MCQYDDGEAEAGQMTSYIIPTCLTFDMGMGVARTWLKFHTQMSSTSHVFECEKHQIIG